MKRAFSCAGAVAIIIGGLVGCGGEDNAATVDDTPAPGSATLVVDGQEQNVQGPVECTDEATITDIAVGGDESGILVAVTKGDNPEVNLLTVGEVDGVSLGFIGGGASPNGSAEVTTDGNTYRIAGKVTGRDLSDFANPGPEIVKPFELTLTCP